MSDHSRQVASAIKGIKKHGRNVDIITASTSGDAWNPARVESTQTIKALNVKFTDAEKSGGIINNKDRKYLIDSEIAVDETMKLKDGANTYSIKMLDPVYPGDQLILQRVHAVK